MKENFKIVFYIMVVFISSFLVLGLFLDAYSQGLLTSEKNIITIGGVVNQNPKQITLDVLQNILGNTQNDNININSLGFRGNEFTEIKPDNTFRIFLVGGSQVFGTGATSDSTTIPGYLQNYLEELDYSFTTEVINSGLKGVDSHKELLLLENMLLDFTPDLVIVYDGLNDLRAGNSPGQIFDNWNSICELGQNNNFDVMITLQPIAGFGKKPLIEEELTYIQNAKDYGNNPLIASLNQYQLYANNLDRLKNCTDSIDLRHVFDNESDSIYIDEAHVSDKGNSIVAKSLIPNILSNIPKNIVSNDFKSNEVITSDLGALSEFQYMISALFSNFEKKIKSTPFSLSENNILSQNIDRFEEIIIKTQSLEYKNNDIVIMIEILPSENKTSNNKIIKLTTLDQIGSPIHNVTYLMTIIKDDSILFTNYFFAENELIIEVNETSDQDIKISGERKYELDALIMSQDNPIIISGSFFNFDSKYEFDIDLRTIHDAENFIILNGFHAEIIP